jgi:predicted dinucleotide-binding enzyme
MKIGILGTGPVGRAHAEKLAALGHDVTQGTKDPGKKLAETKTDEMGNAPYGEWRKTHPSVKLGTFAEAAGHGEMVYNALKGEAAVKTLKPLKDPLKGKILVDISNALDFSKGMPPTLFVCNTDSLGERIQRALPAVKVVKSFNTINAQLQVNPGKLSGGDHHIFVGGNDDAAKADVMRILKDWYGWKNIIDLGDITSARGTEMMMLFWIRMWGVLKTPVFNYKIVK